LRDRPHLRRTDANFCNTEPLLNHSAHHLSIAIFQNADIYHSFTTVSPDLAKLSPNRRQQCSGKITKSGRKVIQCGKNFEKPLQHGRTRYPETLPRAANCWWLFTNTLNLLANI